MTDGQGLLAAAWIDHPQADLAGTSPLMRRQPLVNTCGYNGTALLFDRIF